MSSQNKIDDSSQFQVGKRFDNPWLYSTYIDTSIKEEEAPENFGGPLPSFKWLCDNLLDKLDQISLITSYYSKTSTTQRKIDAINTFFTEWRTVVGPNIYPALVLILPHKDRSRVYNIKDKFLGRRLLEILKVPKNSVDAEHISNWKQSRYNKGQKMSSICVEIIKKRRVDIKGGILSISDVNDVLDLFASPKTKKQDQIEILSRLIDQMSFVELQYFFDILLKKNVVRNMENRILYLWHPDAIDYLSVVTSLKTVAYTLSDPSIRLNQKDLTVNLAKPFAPQLADRPKVSYQNITEKLKNDFFVEEKMDGERIQVHFEQFGQKIHYWSRKATDYTYLYGENLDSGCISPYIHLVPTVKSCVLDGEMVTFDPERGAILPFGVLKGSAVTELMRIQDGEVDKLSARPLLMIFDIVFLNGVSLTNVSLDKRKEYLTKILVPKPGFVEIIDTKRGSDEEVIKKALVHAVERGSEGIVLKKALSKYYIGKRNFTWIKVKPEYLEEFGENVDLIVIGREKSKKDMFYCGLRITDDDTDSLKIPKFYSFCRVANGFDSNDYRKIEELTRGKWKNYDTSKPPDSLIEFGKRVPIEWIDPRESFVIEVKARSIDRSISKNYRTSTTLYNSYCRAIRDDKDWESATTLDEYKSMKDSRTVVDDKELNLVRKKRKLDTTRKRETKDEEVWIKDDVSLSSNVFSGITFMFLTDGYVGESKYSVDELFELINRNGGKGTKNQFRVEDAGKLRIVSDKVTSEAIELRKLGYDILKTCWVYDCLQIKDIIRVEPKHCLLVSQQLETLSKKRVNSLGVGFYTESSFVDLKALLDKSQEIDKSAEIDERLKTVWLFGNLRVYLEHLGDDSDLNYRLTKINLEAFGAEVTKDLEGSNLVVVTDHNNLTVNRNVKLLRKKLAKLITFTKTSVRTARIVNSDWVEQSIVQGVMVDPEKYPVISSRD